MTSWRCSRLVFARGSHCNDQLRDADEITPQRIAEDVSPKTAFTPTISEVVNECEIANAPIDNDQFGKRGASPAIRHLRQAALDLRPNQTSVAASSVITRGKAGLKTAFV